MIATPEKKYDDKNGGERQDNLAGLQDEVFLDQLQAALLAVEEMESKLTRKMQARIDAISERLATAQAENAELRRQLANSNDAENSGLPENLKPAQASQDRDDDLFILL